MGYSGNIRSIMSYGPVLLLIRTGLHLFIETCLAVFLILSTGYGNDYILTLANSVVTEEFMGTSYLAFREEFTRYLSLFLMMLITSGRGLPKVNAAHFFFMGMAFGAHERYVYYLSNNNIYDNSPSLAYTVTVIILSILTHGILSLGAFHALVRFRKRKYIIYGVLVFIFCAFVHTCYNVTPVFFVEKFSPYLHEEGGFLPAYLHIGNAILGARISISISLFFILGVLLFKFPPRSSS
ncbi:hypothetical protein KCG44_06745 [Pacificimonas sp. WHA3]|uniref:PrsW family intramembrane metalloprotease n=1 Tax=Pacificimonas pallii TaxID=2827236 RepID=A0ABS6SDK0_9SPHN|nr:hypothetical protein [Pacificimonas pallii]MBV7256483.1 hypothetical protein [Pacificimonas pallii]